MAGNGLRPRPWCDHAPLSRPASSRRQVSRGSRVWAVCQGETEGRAAIGRGFCPDAAAVAADDPMYRRQSDARALEFAFGVQALEGAEELAGILHVEPRAVVPDEIDGRRGGLSADLDPGRVATARELPRVLEEGFESKSQETRVSLAGNALWYREFNCPRRLCRAQSLRDITGDCRKVEWRPPEFRPLDPGEAEQPLEHA